MKSTVETLSPTRVRLAIEVPFAELEPNLRKAYRAVSTQVTIPGFRKGKAPARVIDQRVGRQTILSEALQDAIPEQLIAAVREHEVQTLGRPEVNVTNFVDGEPLTFTAEIDVRPEFELPDLASIEVTVDEVQVDDAEVDAELDSLRQRFATLKSVDRPAQRGDFVQIDLAASIDGEIVEGGTANNLSHEVGGPRLLEGLDDALVGMAADDSGTFTTMLAGGDLAGREAEVAVTVRTVKERELPEWDDEFASLASEFDTVDEVRADAASRLNRIKQGERIYAARDKALTALIEAAQVPAPEGLVRDGVTDRKEAMTEQLTRIGASIEDYLASESKTEEDLDADLMKAVEEEVKTQLVLDALAEREKIEVSDAEYGQEIMMRAQRARIAPQQYYDQLVRSGAAGAVYNDVRRGKALAFVLERVAIRDTSGAVVTFDDLRGGTVDAEDDDHAGHDHD